MESAPANRVLLVEDHADTLQSLVRLLSRNGYAVCPAATYREALDLAARANCRVVVADVSLPDGSGVDLMRHLAPRGVIGVAISGHAAEEVKQAARDAGFGAYLVKPIDFAELLSVLARMTGS